jgi:predicted transcriptional regulator
MQQEPNISETELSVLKALWEHEPATVRELAAVLADRGRSWAYTTVQTLLNRLRAKGVVESDTAGHAHVYRAAVSREGLLRARLSALADELCEGTATPLVHALVESDSFSKDDLASFRELIERLNGDGKKSSTASRRTTAKKVDH